MSNTFNTNVRNAKIQIQEECQRFKNNYLEFLPVKEQIINSPEIDDHTINSCKEFFSDLNEGNIRLVFCGQVKSGKSRCIIEFLSGKLRLPTYETPMTTYFTVIFFSEDFQLYSSDSNKKIKHFEFDGKCVNNDVVGRTKDSPIEDADLDVIFYVGTPNTFQQDNFIIIDTPGLNEKKIISDSFFKNIKKINPQIIVYLFDAAPGFTVSDGIYCNDIIANCKKTLKKIFLFNKFDVAFKREVGFPNQNEHYDVSLEKDDDEDDECTVDDDDDDDEYAVYDDDDDVMEYEKKYATDYEMFLDKLSSFNSKDNELKLMGYSGRLVQTFRVEKENFLNCLLIKHIDFLLEIKNQINIINEETNESILNIFEHLLFTKLKKVYDQILGTKDTDFQRTALSGVAKERIVKHFEMAHAEINIQPPKMNKGELDSMINEIIKQQMKHISKDEPNFKLKKIGTSLINFLINRYFNLFTNVIQTSLDSTSFNSFSDMIKKNDIQNFFPHTFCTLKYESENFNLYLIIEQYFRDQYQTIRNSVPQPLEKYKDYFKRNVKYDIESILPFIEDYKIIKLRNERKLLEVAIDKKVNEINDNFQLTEQETDVKIKETLTYFKIWFKFNNNYLMILRNSSKITEEKRTFIDSIIDGTANLNTRIHNFSNNITISKVEKINLDEISCRNCDIIQYVLRTQYISDYLFKCLTYFHERTGQLYFLTDIKEFQPLRQILPKLSTAQKIKIFQKLTEIANKLYVSRIPITNFGPDMIFCKSSSEDEVDIKLTETVQEFQKWKFTVANGELCDQIVFKYPFYESNCSIGETMLSMFYGLTWTILIILHGSCERMFQSNVENKDFLTDLDIHFKNHKNKKTYILCKMIIEKCLKRPFDKEILMEISRLFKSIKYR